MLEELLDTGSVGVLYRALINLTLIDRGDLRQLAPRKKLLKSCWDLPSFHGTSRTLRRGVFSFAPHSL
jgi:hypothetical protein